jgi:hypothetical protein
MSHKERPRVLPRYAFGSSAFTASFACLKSAPVRSLSNWIARARFPYNASCLTSSSTSIQSPISTPRGFNGTGAL